MDTAQGRKLWYQDLKPKNFSIDELQKFTKGVKEYNQGAQDYERARRKVQEGKISTSDFARLYDEKGWGKYDQATMKEGYQGQFQDAADEAQKRKEANMGVTDAVLELTGAPALSRIIQDPMGTLKGVGNTAADIAMSAAPGFGSVFGAGDPNVNPLTGNQYWSGLDKTLDVAGIIPGIGSLGKLGKVGKFGKVGSYAEDVLGTSKKITSAPKNMNIKLLPDDIRSKELDMETFGVYKGDTKVGEVSGNRLSSGDFETLDIGVDPKFQRQGIGTEVYKQLNQSLPEGNKVRSWGAFVENNGVAPGRNTWQSLERQGLAKQNEKGIYEMLPNINETVDLWRIQEKGARPMAELATEGKLGKHFQNEKAIKHFKDREEHFGQWFTKDKNDFDFYKTDREFIDPEVIKLQVPKSKLKSFSNYNKSLSRAPDREFVVPKDQQELYRTQYKKGGYIDAELTPEEIEWYRSQGYQVEDMD
jgi:GNAT superfamily N-acetyltransferase